MHGLWRKRLLYRREASRFPLSRCVAFSCTNWPTSNGVTGGQLARLGATDAALVQSAAWPGFARMRANREMACDALALAHLGKAPSERYGETIIKVVENLVRPPRAAGLLALSKDKRQLEERIRMIAAFRKRPACRSWRCR